MALGKAITDPVARHRRMLGGHRHVAQRHRLRHPGERHRRHLVHGPGGDARGALFPRLSPRPTPIPDIGDSTIVETIGLGGFAMAAAPAVAGFVGAGAASEAANYHPKHGRRSPWARTRNGLSRRSTTRAFRPVSISAWSWRPAWRRPSTPASPTKSRASDRSAPAWSRRRWPASPKPCGGLADTLGVT